VALKPLRRSSLSEDAAEAIKEYILESSLKAGDKLPSEKELSEMLQISRTALREGLKYLESLGILESNKGGGRFLKHFEFDAFLDNVYFAFRFTDKRLDEVLEARRMLEISLISWIVERITEEEIQALYRILDMMKAEYKDTDTQLKYDFLFHKTLLCAAKNEIVAEFASILDVFFKLIRSKGRRSQMTKERFELIISEHEKMIEYVKEKKVDEMAALLNRHLDRYEQTLVKTGIDISIPLNDVINEELP
jgi:GntR family transcriptional repressor for pyruvate dehydrogenase complex